VQHLDELALALQLGETSVSTDLRNKKRTARLVASKLESRDVQEKEKPLASYMQLPASQYSVLGRCNTHEPLQFMCASLACMQPPEATGVTKQQ